MKTKIFLPIMASILILGVIGLSDASKVYGHGTIDQSFTGPFDAGFALSEPAGQTFTTTASNLVGVDIFLFSVTGETLDVARRTEIRFRF